jgi:hypothetical protein
MTTVNSPDGLGELLSSVVTHHGYEANLEVALLHVMKKYHFSTSLLQQILEGLLPSVNSPSLFGAHLGLNHLFRGSCRCQFF